MKKLIAKHQGKVILGLALVLVLTWTIIGIAIRNTKPSQKNTLISLALAPAKSLEQKKVDLNKLEFNDVERHNVVNAKSTVILIPQIHKEPTTQANDPKNDNALVVQKEISSMLNKLIDKNNVRYIMDETDLYGPMPEIKINKIKTGFSDVAQFKKSLEETLARYIKDGGDRQTAEQIRQRSLDIIDQFERNIYLTGGAAVVAGTNQNAIVYGSQNKSTIDIATAKLQNIVYLEQRIKQLEGNSGGSGSQNSTIGSILSLLGDSSRSKPNILLPLSAFAQEKDDEILFKQIEKTNAKIQSLSVNRTFEATAATSVKQPTINPYKNRNDLENLKQEYKSANDDFMKIAKDQRSLEVADNAEKMMAENNQKASVLVLGAGHKEDMINILNKKGINVIVITPESENYQVA